MLVLVAVFVMAIQPAIAGAVGFRPAEGPLARLAALIGPLCSIAADQTAPAGGAPPPAGGHHDRAGCCLPGCPMLGGPLPPATGAPLRAPGFAASVLLPPNTADSRPRDDARTWAPPRGPPAPT
ncbi:hypothetical protein L2U69_09070 [Zavarzinia compransoris]|nr:hypothetical protein [Zavarzinia marina]